MDQKFWDTNAQAWAQVIRSEGIASRSVTNQAILQKILEKTPESVIDLGCGEGFLCAGIRRQGILYHGVDASMPLIEMAREAHGDFFSVVSYEDLSQASWQPPQKFSLAVFNFSLFQENLVPLLKALRAILTPQAQVLVQTLHPCFALPTYRSGWNVEDFKSMSVPFSGTMEWYGRTLQDWFKEFAEAGWVVESLSEPSLEGKPVSILFELKNA